MDEKKEKKEKKVLFTAVEDEKKETAKPAEDVKDNKLKWSFIATFPMMIWHYLKPGLGFMWLLIYFIIIMPLNYLVIRPIRSTIGTLPLIIVTTVVAFIVVVVGVDAYVVAASSDPWYARMWQWVFQTEPSTWISRVWEHWFS